MGYRNSGFGAIPAGDLNSRTGILQNNGAITIVIVQEFETIEGRLYLHCYDPTSGEAFSRVPLLVPAGDNSERYFRPAVAKDGSTAMPVNPDETSETTQAILVRRGIRKAPYCIGFVRHPNIETESVEPPTPSADGDRSTLDYGYDHTLRNAGASFIVGSDGSVILSTPESTSENDAKARIQLGKSSQLRISIDGLSGDGLVVASKLIEYLNILEARLDALFAWADLVGVVTEVVAPSKSSPGTNPGNSELISSVIEIPSDSENA